MPKVPPPPAAGWLAANVQPVIRVIPAGDRLWRIYKTGGTYPQAWNTFRGSGPLPACRFDHHDPAAGTNRSILYAGANPTTAIAEVFQSTRTIDRWSLSPEVAAFACISELQLLDVSPASLWSIRAGASAAMQFGNTKLCQAWSRAAYADYGGIHGIAYASTMTGGLAVALFERAQLLMPSHPIVRRKLASLSLVGILKAIAHDLGDWPIV